MNELRDTFDWLKQMSKNDFPVLKPEPAQIHKIVAKIGERLLRTFLGTEMVLERWKAAKEINNFEEITSRDIKGLCSESEVVFDDRFIELILEKNEKLSRSAIKRLTGCYAFKWLEHENDFKKLLLKLGPLCEDPYVEKISPYLEGGKGIKHAAQNVLEELSPISDMLAREFGLHLGDTQYAFSVRQHIGNQNYHVALSRDSVARGWFYREILKEMDKETLLPCLEPLTQAIQQTELAVVKDDFLEFVLNHKNLGDPRLFSGSSWWVEEASSTNFVIEWLSQADVSFFFDVFIDGHDDYQGRKDFWLKYAHAIRGTRVIMSDAARQVHLPQLKNMGNKKINPRILARLTNGTSGLTAFLMDFGEMKVVEFSRAGNACFFYIKKNSWKYNDRQLFWDEKVFDQDDLKSNICEFKLTHLFGWQSNFSKRLAMGGVRRRSK